MVDEACRLSHAGDLRRIYRARRGYLYRNSSIDVNGAAVYRKLAGWGEADAFPGAWDGAARKNLPPSNPPFPNRPNAWDRRNSRLCPDSLPSPCDRNRSVCRGDADNRVRGYFPRPPKWKGGRASRAEDGARVFRREATNRVPRRAEADRALPSGAGKGGLSAGISMRGTRTLGRGVSRRRTGRGRRKKQTKRRRA